MRPTTTGVSTWLRTVGSTAMLGLSRSLTFAATLSTLGPTSPAQQLSAETSPDDLWQRVRVPSVSVNAELFTPTLGAYAYALNQAAMSARLATVRPNETSALISIPTVSGAFETFLVQRTASISPGLTERFGVATWSGRSSSNPRRRLSLVTSRTRITTLTIDDERRESMRQTGDGLYAVIPSERIGSDLGWACAVTSGESRDSTPTSNSWAGGLRTFRIAIACTGEYGTEVGGTVDTVLEAIAYTLQGVNDIYRRELGIQFVLAESSPDLFFLDPSSDNLTNGDRDVLLKEAQKLFDDVIRDENYDIGHVIYIGPGGKAAKGAGIKGLKGTAVSGLGFPWGKDFEIDFVAHEIGHQFGANHTFASNAIACVKSFYPASACEPGAGSTILSYAGNCKPDSFSVHSDPYFHALSLAEMRTYLAALPASVGQISSTTDRAPLVSAGADFFVPRLTSFRLIPGAFGDPDGDQLSFCWEQMDTAAQPTPLGSGDTRNGPIFRSFHPSCSTVRTLPRMDVVLSGKFEPQERLPRFERELNFRLTVRANHGSDAAGVAFDDITVRVAGDSDDKAFAITFPKGPLRAGVHTVTWEPGASLDPRVNCTAVNVLVSTDGGKQFRERLSNIPNSGSAQISIPDFTGLEYRIMVESADHRFFSTSSSFKVLPADVSIEIAPSKQPPELTPDKLTALFGYGGWDHIVVNNSSGATLYSRGGTLARYGSMDTLLPLLKTPSSPGIARTVLMFGDATLVGNLSSRYGAEVPPGLARVVLSIASDGAHFSMLTRDPQDKLNVVYEKRTGAWFEDANRFDASGTLKIE